MSNKNLLAWYFIRPAQPVTWRTVAIVIRVILLSPYLRIRGFLCLPFITNNHAAYTGCPRRKGPNSGRVFLRSNYTDITRNTYIQSSMVTEICNIEKWGLVWCLCTVLCPWRHTRIRLRCNAIHSVALGSVRQLVDYVLGANIRFVFVIARQWFG